MVLPLYNHPQGDNKERELDCQQDDVGAHGLSLSISRTIAAKTTSANEASEMMNNQSLSFILRSFDVVVPSVLDGFAERFVSANDLLLGNAVDAVTSFGVDGDYLVEVIHATEPPLS